MEIDRRWARALTLDELLAVKLTVVEAGSLPEAFVNSMIRVFDIGLRDLGSSWEQEEAVKPWDFALPQSQWEEIVGWLCERVDGSLDLTKVNVLLDWMNKGPSADATLDDGAASLKD